MKPRTQLRLALGVSALSLAGTGAIALAWHATDNSCRSNASDLADMQEQIDGQGTVQLDQGMKVARLQDQVEGLLAREKR